MRKALFGMALALVAIAPVMAHHSPAAFDQTKTVTLTGTIKEFRWQNPHTWIEVLVPNEKGQDVLWAFELGTPTTLVRAGWKSNTLKPGDKVTIAGRPLKSGEAGAAIFTSVTLADGRTLGERGGGAGRGEGAGRGAGRGN